MIKLLVDVGLSPDWVGVFVREGWPAVHWSNVSDARAKDHVIMTWAREHAHVVFTHDLDFGTLLALTRAAGPSVIQVRTQDVLPQHLGEIVVHTIRTHQAELQSGALMTVDETRGKVRLLPIGSSTGL